MLLPCRSNSAMEKAMPTIKITDTLNADIAAVSANPNSVTSALEKYVTSPAVDIVLLPDLVNALGEPLIAAKQTPLSLGLNFSDKTDFGTSANPDLTIAAGVTQKVNVNATPGANLFASDPFLAPASLSTTGKAICRWL